MVGSKSLFGVLCVAGVLAGATGCATAQIIERLFPFLAPASPAVTTSVPDPKSYAPDWSGQSGSSGHPLMTASRVRLMAEGAACPAGAD